MWPFVFLIYGFVGEMIALCVTCEFVITYCNCDIREDIWWFIGLLPLCLHKIFGYLYVTTYFELKSLFSLHATLVNGDFYYWYLLESGDELQKGYLRFCLLSFSVSFSMLGKVIKCYEWVNRNFSQSSFTSRKGLLKWNHCLCSSWTSYQTICFLIV